MRSRLSVILVVVVFLELIAVSLALSDVMGRDRRSLDLAAGPKPSFAHEIVIEGRVTGTGTATVVLRIDDTASHDYASRFNRERKFPIGDFHWSVPLGGITSMRGDVMDLARLKQIMAFKAAGSADVRIDRIALVETAPLPGGSRGYAFGPADAPLAAGFERIAPGDPRIVSGEPVAIRRPMPDPLIASGIRGITRIRLPWSAGPVSVTLWTEDPGEWEFLPHPLRRRISVSGKIVLNERFTPQEWIRQRYLRGRADEHPEGTDAWRAFGRRRGGELTAIVEATDNAVVIDLDANEPSGRFLSAVLLAPVDDGTALASVNARRADWYRSNWPVLGDDTQARDDDIVPIFLDLAPTHPQPTLSLKLAPGTGERLRLLVNDLGPDTIAKVHLETPESDRQRLSVSIWAARERLERRRAQDSFLTRTDNFLDGVASISASPATNHRLFELWVSSRPTMRPGRRLGHVIIEAAERSITVPITIDVLPVELPPATKAAGPYLDESPHFKWFPELADHIGRQLDCDASFVEMLGLAGSAASVAMPDGNGNGTYADLTRAQRNGFAMPTLAYAAAKRTLHALGPDAGARAISGAVQTALAAGLNPPVWSLVDEPSNPGAQLQPWPRWLEAIRGQPGVSVRLAAHLNAPRDQALLDKFDVVLVNGGFGLDIATIERARAAGPEVWLYNTEAPRLTAGAWLWRSAARRYVQWHARMPTADPFDPLDGREGDEQFILPSAAPCPSTPSIHRDLLDLADGVVDQRWLLWLDAEATPSARDLRSRIERRIGVRWDRASRMTRRELREIRESIKMLVQSKGAAQP